MKTRSSSRPARSPWHILAFMPFFAVATACGGTIVRSSDGGGGDSGSPDSPSSDSFVPDVVEPDVADASDGGPADGPLPVPVNHRTDDSQCGTVPAPGTCSFGSPYFMCSMDSQCTDGGPNGRCITGSGGPAYCGCTYDTCVHDTDCATGELCVCHGSPYTNGAGNTCMPGNCRVDSDCGSGGYCSPAHGTTGCGGISGYYCHTRQDTCTNDSDCGSGLDVCTWSDTDARWECQMQLLCA